MTATEVVELARSLGFSAAPTAYGIDLGGAGRLERGSGIAGRADAWSLVDRRGQHSTPYQSDRRGLRRVLLEVLHGRPAARGHHLRMHRSRFGDAVVEVRTTEALEKRARK